MRRRPQRASAAAAQSPYRTQTTGPRPVQGWAGLLLLVACADAGAPTAPTAPADAALATIATANAARVDRTVYTESGTLTTGSSVAACTSEPIAVTYDRKASASGMARHSSARRSSSGGNFVVLNTFHITLGADGEIDVLRNEFSAECR